MAYSKLIFITWPGKYTGAVLTLEPAAWASPRAGLIPEMRLGLTLPGPWHLPTSPPRPAEPCASRGQEGEFAQAVRSPPPRRGQRAHTGAGFEGFRSQQAVALSASDFGFGWMTPEPRLTSNQRRRSLGAPGVTCSSCRLELASPPSSSPQSQLKLPPALPKN